MIITHQRAPETMQFGIHLMVDGYMADPAALANKDQLVDLLNRLPAELGMHQICTPVVTEACLLYTSPSPRDATLSRMPSSA